MKNSERSPLQLRLVAAQVSGPDKPQLPPVQPEAPPDRLPATKTPLSDSARLAPPAIDASQQLPTPQQPEHLPSTSSPQQISDLGDYLPRPLLSVSPTPISAVVLAAPPGELIATRQTGTLSLFIDEKGQVQRVETNESELAPVLEKSARAAFMSARFLPGQVDGRPVKSRLRIEVSFEPTSPEVKEVMGSLQ